VRERDPPALALGFDFVFEEAELFDRVEPPDLDRDVVLLFALVFPPPDRLFVAVLPPLDRVFVAVLPPPDRLFAAVLAPERDFDAVPPLERVFAALPPLGAVTG
jgi:hypothetical protein